MTKEIAKTNADKYKGIKNLFHNSEKAIIEVMPNGTDFKRMVGGLLMQTRVNPALLDCTGESILVCGLTALSLGLETTPAFHQVALVPFNRSVKAGSGWRQVKEAQIMIEYRGLITLATKSGEVVTIDAYLVYEKEISKGLFTIEYGLAPNVVHKPTLRPNDRGEIAGVYAVAFFKDGTRKFHYMWLEEVYKRRDSSKAYQNDLKYNKKDSPWIAWKEEMIKKTAIKGLARTLQLSPKKPEFARAVTLDNLADGGKSQIPHLTEEIGMSGIDIPGTFNELAPDPDEIATIKESDFGKTTEGEGDPAKKEQPVTEAQTDTSQTTQVTLILPKNQKKEINISDSEIEENRELIKETYNLLRGQDQHEIIRKVFPDDPQRRKIGKWNTMPVETLSKIYAILHSSPIMDKAREILLDKKEQTSTKKEETPKNTTEGESPQTARGRVINWIIENESLHHELKLKLSIVFPDCHNLDGYITVGNLEDDRFITDGDIKKIDETLREAGLYK